MRLFDFLTRDSNYEIILPKTLFKLYDTSINLSGDNVCHSWANVIIDKRGHLCVEENSITYSAHNIAHNTGRRTTHKVVSFEQLPELISRSNDPAAMKYSNMSQTDWKDYIKEPKAVEKASKYPIITLGKYEWYVLDQQENDTLPLLSKYGIDTRPWNCGKKRIDWTESTLCNWLNSSFIKKSFTMKQQRALMTFVDGTKVSLLDSNLIEKYLKDDAALTAKPNLYALMRGAFSYTYDSGRPDYKTHVGNGLVWLKDTYKGDDESLQAWAHCIYWNGSICMYSFDFEKAIVRPIIRINRKLLKL